MKAPVRDSAGEMKTYDFEKDERERERERERRGRGLDIPGITLRETIFPLSRFESNEIIIDSSWKSWEEYEMKHEILRN